MTAMPDPSHFESKNMLWLEVTNFCNLQCGHCYNSSGPHEPLSPSLPPSRYKEILAEARAMAFKRVQFIGGEPMFYPHLRELVDCAAELGFQEIEVFSNLTTVPRWLLASPRPPVRLATSFYSASPETHDAITETAGSFARTIAAIRKVIAAGYDLRVGFIEMEANAGHYDAARALLESLGVGEISHDVVRKFGRAEAGDKAALSELCGHCASGNMSVDVHGRVSGCIMSKPWSFGNAGELSLQDLFDSEGRLAFARDLERDVRKRPVISPSMCTPYDQGQCGPNCAPSCAPSQGCNPSMDRTPCNPNGRCGPF